MSEHLCGSSSTQAMIGFVPTYPSFSAHIPQLRLKSIFPQEGLCYTRGCLDCLWLSQEVDNKSFSLASEGNLLMYISRMCTGQRSPGSAHGYNGTTLFLTLSFLKLPFLFLETFHSRRTCLPSILTVTAIVLGVSDLRGKTACHR